MSSTQLSTLLICMVADGFFSGMNFMMNNAWSCTLGLILCAAIGLILLIGLRPALCLKRGNAR